MAKARMSQGNLVEQCTRAQHLTVRLLEASTGTTTTELLWLWATRIGNKEGTIVVHEDVLDLTLGGLIHIFLVPCHQRLGDGLADSIDLGSVTTTLDTDADVDLTVPVGTEEEDRLPHLKAECLGLHELDWHTVDLDEALALLHEGNSDSFALASKCLHGLHSASGPKSSH